MAELKFTVLTDTHYYSKKNWPDGTAYDFPPKNDQIYLRGTEEIIKHTFDEFIADKEKEIILIAGDLSNNGELTSHEEMRDELLRLKEAGKKVYVITATHDCPKEGHSYGFDRNNTEISVPSAKKEDLLGYYHEFGFDDALSIHEESMSYVAQLADGFRLLALNDDYEMPKCGFSDDCFSWIEQQVKSAKEEGQFVLAMVHHPILPPSKLFLLIAPNDMLFEHEKRARQLADLGIPCVLTGHDHMQNISMLKTENGNRLYDISTSALTGFPPAYRDIVINTEERKIDVKTTIVDNVKNLDIGGLSLYDFTKDLFLGCVLKAMVDAQNDYDRFADFAIGMSISRETSYKYKFIVKPAAKFLDNLTFGKVWKLTRLTNKVSKAEIEPIYNKKAAPFMIDIAANLYKGDADLDVNSAEFKITYALLKMADKLSKPFSKKLQELGIDSITDTVMPLLYKYGIRDNDAVLYY